MQISTSIHHFACYYSTIVGSRVWWNLLGRWYSCTGRTCCSCWGCWKRIAGLFSRSGMSLSTRIWGMRCLCRARWYRVTWWSALFLLVLHGDTPSASRRLSCTPTWSPLNLLLVIAGWAVCSGWSMVWTTVGLMDLGSCLGWIFCCLAA